MKRIIAILLTVLLLGMLTACDQNVGRHHNFKKYFFHAIKTPCQLPICCHLHYTSLAIEKIAYFMKLVGWEQLATQGVPRWQVHKRVAGGSQRRGSVASPV